MEWIVEITVTALFLALGFLFCAGKGAFLIAGYNTMPKEAKEQIDEKKLCKYMSLLMFAFAAGFALITAGGILDKAVFIWLGWGLFVVS